MKSAPRFRQIAASLWLLTIVNVYRPWEAYASTPDEDGDACMEELGGVVCSTPIDCSKKCFADKKFCVEYFFHPYKPEVGNGALFDCIDSFPPAKVGGSFTCLYKYSNGDVCIISRSAKLGPLHPPAPPPLCIYKS